MKCCLCDCPILPHRNWSSHLADCSRTRIGHSRICDALSRDHPRYRSCCQRVCTQIGLERIIYYRKVFLTLFRCQATESSAKASFYGRMIISMILIISIFQSLAASARTAGAQKARTVGVHLLCSPLYSSINIWVWSSAQPDKCMKLSYQLMIERFYN